MNLEPRHLFMQAFYTNAIRFIHWGGEFMAIDVHRLELSVSDWLIERAGL